MVMPCRAEIAQNFLQIHVPNLATCYAVLVGGSNGDGAWLGLVTLVELIDPRPYILQSAVYGRLIYTVIYMSDRLLTQANPDPCLPPPPELRSKLIAACPMF